MRQALKLHPESRCTAVTAVDVDVARSPVGTLLFSYCLTGSIADLRLPPSVPSARVDELWRHTCFEAFLCPAADEPYYEFNFAPSTQWAAYRFSGYRRGMRVAGEIGSPRFEVRSTPNRYVLQAALGLDLPGDTKCCLGLAAVIEEARGRLCYWALAHPPGQPDFHRADCFTCQI